MNIMEEIEKIAEQHIDEMYGSGEIEMQKSFVMGAEWMRKELTCWNDPKEPPAHPNVWALLKCADDKFDIGYWTGKAWRQWSSLKIIS